MAKKPEYSGAIAAIKAMSPQERKEAARRARAMIRWPAHPFARRYQTPEDMEPAVREYFETCASIARPYTWGGLATFLGMHTSNLRKYKVGEIGENPEDKAKFIELLEVADQVIETSKQEMGLLGIYNAAFTQFDLKNNHGWKEKQEIEHLGHQPVEVKRTFVDPNNDQS